MWPQFSQGHQPDWNRALSECFVLNYCLLKGPICKCGYLLRRGGEVFHRRTGVQVPFTCNRSYHRLVPNSSVSQWTPCFVCPVPTCRLRPRSVFLPTLDTSWCLLRNSSKAGCPHQLSFLPLLPAPGVETLLLALAGRGGTTASLPSSRYFPHGSGSQESKIKVLTNMVSGKIPLAGL